ncbi:MAG: prephenate dehydrogenase/arogenate dehydrogenase family protein [Vicinamibacterales bacterium]
MATPTRKRPPFDSIAIVGVGLIGGSIAMAARRRWPEVELIGIERAARARSASVARLVDRVSSALVDVAAADLIVLAGPVDANIRLLGRLAALRAPWKPGVVITDVGSTKQDIQRAATGLDLGHLFIGGHPIAGSERSGARHASVDLFDGAIWALTPQRARGARLAALRRFVRGLGARDVRLAAEEHDRTFAWVSHLPQVAASALMSLVGARAGRKGLRLSAGGLRDTTRIAGSSPTMWTPILHANRRDVSAAIEAYVRALTAMRRSLDSPRALDARLRAANAERSRLTRARTARRRS